MKKLIYFVMAVALAYGSIYGTVTDAAIYGEPIRGASVQLGTGGKFEFRDLDAGTYAISVQKAGCKAYDSAVDVVSGEVANISVLLVSE